MKGLENQRVIHRGENSALRVLPILGLGVRSASIKDVEVIHILVVAPRTDNMAESSATWRRLRVAVHALGAQSCHVAGWGR